jgi:transcriptional regulator with XRE-family HTH domain
MAMSLDQFVAEHPGDREKVDAHKARMLAEMRAYRLREIRENARLTQAQLAECIGVGQRQISKIERGDLDSVRVGTIRRYIEALGGELALEYIAGDQRLRVA